MEKANRRGAGFYAGCARTLQGKGLSVKLIGDGRHLLETEDGVLWGLEL